MGPSITRSKWPFSSPPIWTNFRPPPSFTFCHVMLRFCTCCHFMLPRTRASSKVAADSTGFLVGLLPLYASRRCHFIGKGTSSLASAFFDVIEIQQPRTLSGDQFPQPGLSLDKRQSAQILAIHEEKIECVEETFAAPEHEIVEDGTAGIVQADDLAIQNRAFRLERLG